MLSESRFGELNGVLVTESRTVLLQVVLAFGGLACMSLIVGVTREPQRRCSLGSFMCDRIPPRKRDPPQLNRLHGSVICSGDGGHA